MSLTFGLPLITALLLVMVRVVAFVVIAPPFSHRGIPAPVKALIAGALAAAMLPRVLDQAGPMTSAGAFFLALGAEVLAGAALGFICTLLYAAVHAAGSFIDLFGGLQLAQAFDPQLATGGGIMGRMYQMTAVVLLFASDAYQVVLTGLARTFDVLPLGKALNLSVLGEVLTGGLAEMFLAGLQVAGPLIAVLFLADVGMGLITRVAPALNAFALGFPLKVLITISMIAVAYAVLPNVVSALARRATELMVGVSAG